MALIANFDMELHQTDVKAAFLNGELEKVIYMKLNDQRVHWTILKEKKGSLNVEMKT